MIKPIAEKEVPDKIEIDLTGPDGNAFVLLGLAEQLGRGLGWYSEDIRDIKEDMKSGDYEHLIEVFDRSFGDFVILYR